MGVTALLGCSADDGARATQLDENAISPGAEGEPDPGMPGSDTDTDERRRRRPQDAGTQVVMPPTSCGDRPLSYDAPAGGPTQPDWSEGKKVPITGLANRYGYSPTEYYERVRKGRLHSVIYPVDVTASWMPKRLLDTIIKADENPKAGAQLLASLNPLSKYKDLEDFERWLGLNPFPECDGQGAQGVPFPDGARPSYRMGSTTRMTPEGEAITYSCAGCHSSELFGRSILGLQNRFSRANVGIEQARKIMSLVPADVVGPLYGGTAGETKMLKRLQQGLLAVGTRAPLVRGLDTSLAQVALSLAKRDKDAFASINPQTAKKPRPEPLETTPADSKPGNWWTLKYKNRWLLDGSVVAGNPVFTNLLWNEIGRGTDLKVLEQWIDKNMNVVDEYTAAVFASEPVRFTEFFPAESVDLAAAKRGKQLFDQTCAKCHGTYKKAWEQPGAASLSLADRLATVEVRYHEDTPVIDVGTDGLRNKGMESIVQLNDLDISKKVGTVIRVQKGYVPPPLVGIWARFPYFHNNSAPSLCAVLSRREERPAVYFAGEPRDPKTDFDEACNGYPTGEAVPAAWKADAEARFDTQLPGLSNQGHDEGVFLKNGQEMFTPQQKRDIIEFLQTL